MAETAFAVVAFDVVGEVAVDALTKNAVAAAVVVVVVAAAAGLDVIEMISYVDFLLAGKKKTKT